MRLRWVNLGLLSVVGAMMVLNYGCEQRLIKEQQALIEQQLVTIQVWRGRAEACENAESVASVNDAARAQ
jgi:hypothetical protein